MIRYLRYNYRKSILDIISNGAFAAITTYMILIRGSIDKDVLTVNGVLLSLSAFLVFWYINNMLVKFYKWLLYISIFNILIDISIILLITYYSNVEVGTVWVFIVIPLTAVMSISEEKKRRFEDKTIKSPYGKKHLELVRKVKFKYQPISILFGSLVAYIVLTIFDMDIRIYAILIWVVFFIIDSIELFIVAKLIRETTIDILL